MVEHRMITPVDRATEETLREMIDPDQLTAHVDEFSGLERVSGSADELQASEYVVETLREYGVEATLETADVLVSIPESAEIVVTHPTRQPIETAITTSFSGNTPATGIHGTVINIPDVTSESVQRASVAGNIVLTKGFPTPKPVQLLTDAGAAGVIYETVSESHLHEMIVTPIWGTPSNETKDELPTLPVAQIHQSDAAWLKELVAGSSVELTLTTEVTTELRSIPFPIGRVDGTESDRYMIVGNHVDSWHEGVTDNATAMAATIELARLFAEHPPKRGVVFAFWPAHSTGRYAGSSWYADREWLDLRENSVLYLHLDLNGLRGADGIWYQHMAELEDEHFAAIDAATDLPPRDDDESFLGSDRPGRNSDQSFWGTGTSSILSGARLEPGTPDGGPIGGGWWWHTPEDTRDKVDIDVLVEETKLFATIAARVCYSPVLPHDFRATVTEIKTQLDEISSASEHAFTNIYDRLALAHEELHAVYDDIDQLSATSDPEFLTAVEDLYVALGNELIPILYVSGTDYGQDPALSQPLLPQLQCARSLPDASGPTRRFIEVSTDRAANRICHRLDRTLRAVRRCDERLNS